ncbi:uncharacterized protein LOC125767076 [Anopheles funestus]|uniref:uncharacterized protein LOC125767076 n=1 Tax=Anopheles funestus TaxID=62324 RepID=UPI0020C739BA|nr:uncharacterized protein LOC125767076 [Anopheles funestus]
MAENVNLEDSEKCIIELECTKDSQPFEPRTVTVVAGIEQIVGRYHNKKSNVHQEETSLLFDNRTLSQNHAALFYQDGKLYLKDLCSLNGTHLNGKFIGPNRDNKIEPTARELKTGDILRFGRRRVIQKLGEIVKPIEAKLTIKHSASFEQPNDQAEDSMICHSHYTPFEGRDLDTTMIAVEQPKKEFISSTVVKVIKRNSKSETVDITERATETEGVNSRTTSTQILPEELEKQTKCESCESISEEFYKYRKRALLVIALCLLVIIFYQLF